MMIRLIIWSLIGVQLNTVAAYAQSDQAYNETTQRVSDVVINDEVSEKAPRSMAAERANQQIQAVLERKEFGEVQTKEGWRLKDRDDKEAREGKFPEWLIRIFEFFERNADNKDTKSLINPVKLSQFLEVLLWALAIGLVAFVVHRYRRQLVEFASSLSSKDAPVELPASMFGLDVKKTSLPDDIVGSARTHWQRQEHRLALSTLLRASLIKLLHEHDCRFFSSDTEAECCDRIDAQAASVISQYMRALVAVWQQVAYAHRLPDDSVFDELCQRWQAVFE